MADNENNSNGNGSRPPWEEEPGWRVLDPEGNVIDWGPGIRLEMTTQMGEAFEELLGQKIWEQ